MSRKTLIICISVLCLMSGCIAAAVAVLYSGTDSSSMDAVQIAEDSRFGLLPAVPADAVAVFCFDEASDAWMLTPFRELDCRMALSFHYSAKLVPLYVFDAGRASQEPSDQANRIISVAKANGLKYQYLDCSRVAGQDRRISGRSLVLVSPSEVILRSSVRHLEKNVSVIDMEDFAMACSAISGSDVMFISNEQASRLLGSVLPRSFSSWSDFAVRLGSWTVAEIDKIGKSGISIAGKTLYEESPSEFMTVLASLEPSQSEAASILPSYTFSAFSLSAKAIDGYVETYKEFLDSRQMLQSYIASNSSLQKETGISPCSFFQRQQVKEVVTASFVAGSVLQRVNLFRFAKPDCELIFKGTGVSDVKNYTPAVHPYPYKSFAGSVFGRIFSLNDESCFTYLNGWLITGSKAAVEEYVSGRATGYTLQENLEDAGKSDIFGSKSSVATAYFSLTASENKTSEVMRKEAVGLLKPFFEDSDICPLIVTIGVGKEKNAFRADLRGLKLEKSKAPTFERDTVVRVPAGPFKVTNSATGRTNLFYQQENLYICLKEEGGKGLWGIPFGKKICGTAENVDYFNNGKIQFLFGAGKEIYLIDRLGRFVSGFPVNLGKDILIGPAVYDFNSSKRYNIMVLHKDNTIEMYNLRGKKPASWKGIKAPETIKGLPERVVSGNKSVWVVRTSIQTLVFPFDGGEPLYSASGDKMIRPDSPVRLVEGTSALEFNCYDGKVRNIVL